MSGIIAYTLEELDEVCKNQGAAISVAVNSLARIRELLNNWKVRPIDLEVCLGTATGAIEKIEDILRKNPVPASTKKWLKTNRQGERKKKTA